MMSVIILTLTVCLVVLTIWLGIDLRKAEKRQQDLDRRVYGDCDDD